MSKPENFAADAPTAVAPAPIGQAPFEDEAPDDLTTSDKLVAFAKDHPALLIVGGLAIGALAAALVRSRSVGKSTATESFARRAATLAAAAGELGLTLSRQARDTAGQATRESRQRIGEGTTVVRQQASKIAHDARDAGKRIAGEAKRIASRHTH